MPPLPYPFARVLPLSIITLLAAAGAGAAAQSSSEPVKPVHQPTQLQHTSRLSTYQAYVDVTAPSWREANDRVGRIGGWRAYAKEVQADKANRETAATASHADHQGAKP